MRGNCARISCRMLLSISWVTGKSLCIEWIINTLFISSAWEVVVAKLQTARVMPHNMAYQARRLMPSEWQQSVIAVPLRIFDDSSTE